MPAHKLTTDIERFRRSVDCISTPDGCWIWSGRQISVYGYGVFSSGSKAKGTFKVQNAHRFALEYALGRPLLPGMQALHVCDVRSCVRNDEIGWYVINGETRPRRGHLWEGTTQDNTADRKAKGRSAYGNRNGAILYPEKLSRGENRYNAKFTEDQVRQIRYRVMNGEKQSTLALEFDVVHTVISKIVRGETWKHV